MDRTSPPAVLSHAASADRAVQHALSVLSDELRQVDVALAPAAEALLAAGSSGKRLRPALLCWSFAAHSGRSAEAVLGAATAVELVHTSALVHDDVIDRSATRRGQASLHARFAAAHGAGWTGTAHDYGSNVAILLGDVLLAAASQHLLACDVPHAVLVRAHEAFTRLQVEVMAGQFLDVDAAARGVADRDRALRIATLKSGRYSVSRPLELGALLAGAEPAAAATLLDVGDPLGVAFQLGDDLLGVFGDPDETGKPSGAYLVAGKRTLLIAETLARLPGAERAAFATRLGAEGLGAQDVARMRATIEDCGARAAVEEHLLRSVDAARLAIDALPLPSPAQRTAQRTAQGTAREDLHGLADWMTARRH
jgi:geranylgeranyl diphosphate synthase type I